MIGPVDFGAARPDPLRLSKAYIENEENLRTRHAGQRKCHFVPCTNALSSLKRATFSIECTKSIPIPSPSEANSARSWLLHDLFCNTHSRRRNPNRAARSGTTKKWPIRY